MNWWWFFLLSLAVFIFISFVEKEKIWIYRSVFDSPIMRSKQCEQNFTPVMWCVVVYVYRPYGHVQHTENNIFTFTCRRHIYYICFAFDFDFAFDFCSVQLKTRTTPALEFDEIFAVRVKWSFRKRFYYCRLFLMCCWLGIQYNTIYNFGMRCTFFNFNQTWMSSVRDRG